MTLKLFDFGLMTCVKKSSVAFNMMYEMTGFTGSLRYMAPEVCYYIFLPFHSCIHLWA